MRAIYIPVKNTGRFVAVDWPVSDYLIENKMILRDYHGVIFANVKGSGTRTNLFTIIQEVIFDVTQCASTIEQVWPGFNYTYNNIEYKTSQTGYKKDKYTYIGTKKEGYNYGKY